MMVRATMPGFYICRRLPGEIFEVPETWEKHRKCKWTEPAPANAEPTREAEKPPKGDKPAKGAKGATFKAGVSTKNELPLV